MEQKERFEPAEKSDPIMRTLVSIAHLTVANLGPILVAILTVKNHHWPLLSGNLKRHFRVAQFSAGDWGLGSIPCPKGIKPTYPTRIGG